MKMKKMLLMVLVACLLLAQTAMAGSGLFATLSGEKLTIRWNAEGACVLTVYRNDWPITVCNVDGASGGTVISVQRGGRYAVRLRTSTGCEKVNAIVVEASANPTEKPTQKPTQNPATPAPTQVPSTPVPTQSPVTPVPTQNPATPAPTQIPATPVPTQAPTTPVPTAKPTAAPTATTAPDQGGQSMTSMAAEVISMVNEERAKYGLPALSVDAQLTSAACVRASEIVELFSHTRPDGSSWSTVSSAARGENIAKGQSSAERVMAAWMSSEGHRANILRESFGSIGVCALKVNGVIYWVQLFGK